MRNLLPNRPLTGAEVLGLVVVGFFLVPFIIGGFLSLVMSLSTWPALLGLVAGAGGALLVQRTLAREAVVNRRRIAELQRENDRLRDQIDDLNHTIDRFIDRHGEPGRA